jgi:hypothetical protein
VLSVDWSHYNAIGSFAGVCTMILTKVVLTNPYYTTTSNIQGMYKSENMAKSHHIWDLLVLGTCVKEEDFPGLTEAMRRHDALYPSSARWKALAQIVKVLEGGVYLASVHAVQ